MSDPHAGIDRTREIRERHYCDPPKIHRTSGRVDSDGFPTFVVDCDEGTRWTCPCGRVFKVVDVPDQVNRYVVMIGGLRWVPIGWFEQLKRKVMKHG